MALLYASVYLYTYESVLFLIKTKKNLISIQLLKTGAKINNKLSSEKMPQLSGTTRDLLHEYNYID